MAQSAENWICMEKNGLYRTNRFYFSGFRKAPDVQIFSGAPFATNAVPEKLSKKACRGAKKKINAVSKLFNFREDDYFGQECRRFGQVKLQ